MDNSDSQLNAKKKINPADKLKNRLFDKGIGHSSMSSFKSPLATDYSNRILLVNLTSANSSKFSPKVIRKQVAGLPNQNIKNKDIKQRSMIQSQVKDRIKTTSNQKFSTKQSQFLLELSQQQKRSNKYQTSSNFYNKSQFGKDEIQQTTTMKTETIYSQQFRRTKQLVYKLAGKTQISCKDQKRSNSVSSQKKQENLANKQKEDKEGQNDKKQGQQRMTLQSYISRALRNQPDLEEFLYLVNSKTKEDGSQKVQEDPYELYIMEYDNNKQIEHKLNQKYYTVSKKGLCYYINSKPVQFIQLEQWVTQKQNYQKIKHLNFFNRFRRWKTVKMWRKIVLRHRIQECSKNLEQKLFFLNPIMRSCLFQVQQISLQLGKNLIILSSNQDDYSLQNFKSIQQKTKRKVSNIIQEYSKNSRTSVKKCFDDNLKNLRSNMKQKQKEEQQQKIPSITSHINLKDSAFQALGFPPKMSYENRSKLRKMAGKFIRFSYLVDMIHTAGLAVYFENQLCIFIQKLQESQSLQNLEVFMTREDNKNPNSVPQQNTKMFNVKLKLSQKQITGKQISLVHFKPNISDGLQSFNPLYHIRISGQGSQQQNKLREYCKNICNYWLQFCPLFEDIYQELNSQIKQSLNCLKFFQRWSKHRDMQKFINILQEWDDVVSQSRQISENQNLDPIIIISNFDVFLNRIKSIIFKSLQIINKKIQEQFTQFLNIHWQYNRLNLDIFKNHKMHSPAETVQSFLKNITTNLTMIQKKIPYRVRLGMFQINLSSVRVQLMKRAEDIYQKFKQILPQIVQQRTTFMNNWLSKYNQVIELQIKNIDDFVNKVKYIKQIQQTFQGKKQLCTNLSSIYQIMQVYKFNTKKRKDFESITLKLKDQLQKQINTFEQNFERQSQNYSRQVNRNYLPNIVKDINKLNDLVKNDKYITLIKAQKNRQQITKQIFQLQKKYQDINDRNKKCLQYQQILNQCHGIDQQSLKSTKSTILKGQKINIQQIPTHLQDLINIKQSIECLQIMWQKYQIWNNLLNKYNTMSVKQILEDKSQLQVMLKQIRIQINDKLKRILGNNQVLQQLNKKVQIFQKYIPIISGLNTNLSDSHWQQINELAHKSSNSVSIDLKKLDTLIFSQMVSSCIGECKQQFQQIFVKASNETNLQYQYNELQKKWRSMVIKTRIQGKYHIIYDDQEHKTVIQFINYTLDTISTIFANPYSIRLQIGNLTYQSIMCVMQTYKKWVSVQRKLVAFDRICKVIDLKKITEGNLLENTQKLYKAIFKILLTRNIQTYFNITKFIPNGNINISQKLQQCQKMLINLQNNIKNMLEQYRKNYKLFYQLNDNQLLRVIMQTSGQQNSTNLPIIIDELICNKFLNGIIKQLKIQGQRITQIYTIDNQNILKSSISLTTDLQTILDMIMDAVSDYSRRMMRGCRNKSIDTSLFEIIDEYNIQYILAICKVDFSNYTSISIQNNTDNIQSLKQYLKILVKDTKNGIQKLKYKKYGNIYGYQTLILQNLIHQNYLQQLVYKNITCANQYTWIKNIRYYWEQLNNGQQISNINIKKMHINLRYGREYIGSKTTVYIDNIHNSSSSRYEYENLDMIMSIIRNSDIYCYMGNMERLSNFINSIGHHLQVIRCNKQMGVSFGNPIKNLLKSRHGTDCIYYIQNAHLLNTDVITDLLQLYPDINNNRNNNGSNLRNTNGSSNNSRRIINNNMDTISPLYISLNDTIHNNYNPIFLHFPINQNNLFTINRLQFRNVSLVVPNTQYLTCYLYLIQQIINYQISCKSQSLSLSLNNNHNNNNNSNKHGLKTTINHKHTKSTRSDLSFMNNTDNKINVSYIQTINVLKKVFDVLGELENTDNNRNMCIQVFLEFVRNKIRRVLPGQQKYKSAINTKIQKLISMSQTQTNSDLHQIIMELVIDYICPIVQPSHFNIITQYIQSMYPKIDIKPNLSDISHFKDNRISVNIITGFKDCLNHYTKINDKQQEYSYLNVINLKQYSQQELFGQQLQTGLLYKLFYGKKVCEATQNRDNKRKIIIQGMSQKLIKYLYSMIQENKPTINLSSLQSQIYSSHSSNSNIQNISHVSTPFKSNLSEQQNKSGCMLGTLAPFIFDFEKISQCTGILQTALNKFYSNSTVATITNKINYIINSDIQIQIHVNQLSQLIDPKVLTQFKIMSAISKYDSYWKYLQHRIQVWLQEKLDKFEGVQNQQKKNLIKNCVHKFYNSTIKGLWKDLYKISDLSATNQKLTSIPITISQMMINVVRDFLNLLQTLLHTIFSSFQTITSTKSQHLFQRTVIYACIYALSFVYRETLQNNTDYIKLESAIQKLQAQPWLCIPQNDRIKPDQYQIADKKKEFDFSSGPKKRFTYFDFFFDGTKLIPIQQYSKLKYPDRVLERGQFYFSDQFIHYNLMAERALNTSRFGLLLCGPRNSGKTAFSKVYKSLHHSQTSHISIHAHNKTKHSIYEKISKVLAIKNLHTICPKLNYENSLIIVDDVSLPDRNSNQKQVQRINQVISLLSSMMKRRAILTPNNFKIYKLQNVNFILSTNGNNKQYLQQLSDCTIKCNFADPFSFHNDQHLRKIFTQVLKANILDAQIQQRTLNKLTDVGFDIYEQIVRKLKQINQNSQNKNLLNSSIFTLDILKNMSIFTSHLRFKQNNPSVNQVSRFWAYLLKDTFQPYCNKFGIQFNNLDSYRRHTEQQSNFPPSQKSIGDFLKQPVKNIMYSHLYVKQQVYGNGKQVEHIKDLKKLYNSINETIQDYNKTDKVRRYGYSFEFVSLDQLFVKIVKISNLLISGDYAIFSRKGSQISGLIRLVSYMQGFNYKQKNNNNNKGRKQSTLIDMVKETILQLTKVSSYLIFMKIDDSNIQQFLEFYDCDFEAEVAGSLQSGDLQSIQSTGAFNFGINSHHQLSNVNLYKNPLMLSQKMQPKANNLSMSTTNQNKSHPLHNHSHTASKDMVDTVPQNKNRSQSANNLQSMRVNKSTLRDINKMKKSIRIFYDFSQLKYLKYSQSHPHYIPSYILSQIHVDFFEQFPQESIIRFSQQILGVNTTNQQQSNEVKQLIQVSKDKLGLMCQVYVAVRQQLFLTSKQYEQCIRLYWSFVGTFPQQIKQKMNKYESILDMNSKLNNIITQFGDKMEAKWEQKKIITVQISKLKSDQYGGDANESKQSHDDQSRQEQNIQQMQSKLLCINAQLQQFTQKKMQCEKIVSFFKPSLCQIERKYQLTKDLCENNFSYLKICLVLTASYFTYLSKLPFVTRKMYLKKWFQVCPSLSKVQQSKRINSISDLFCLIREEDMIINEQNEQFYENMTIILQSIKPVLIRDDKYLGRSWMKSFDTSFATVSQHSVDFYQKLKQYLANSNNILLEITDQLTLNNSQSNFINSLIFMSENTPNIVINDQQYPVSKETKVYVVVAPHVQIPDQIMSQHLYVTYQQSQSTLLKNIQHQIMMVSGAEKFTQYLDYKKKQLFVMNQCLSLEFSLANMVWHQFYGKTDQQEDQLQHQSSKDGANNKNGDQKKSKTQLLQHIQFLAKKGVIDKLQQFVDKYNAKMKLLNQIRDKMSGMVLVSNYNQINTKQSKSKPLKSSNKLSVSSKSDKKIRRNSQTYNQPTALSQILNIISKSYNLIIKISQFNSQHITSLETYYQTIKQAIRQGLVIVNLSQTSQPKKNAYNMGMFILFILRQWGVRLSRQLYTLMSLGLIAILEQEINRTTLVDQKQIKTDSYVELLQMFTKSFDQYYSHPSSLSWSKDYLSSEWSSQSKILSRIIYQLSQKSMIYSIQTIQTLIIESLQQYIDEENNSQLILAHNNIPTLSNTCLMLNKKVNKVDSNVIDMSSLFKQISDIYGADQSWLLKYLVIFTGKVQSNLFKSELESEMFIQDSQTYNNWLVRKSVQKLVQTESVNLVELKNNQNIENQVKKILNDKQNIFVPVIDRKSNSKAMNKSNALLKGLLTQFVLKYAIKNSSRRSSDAKSNGRPSKSSLNLSGIMTSSQLNRMQDKTNAFLNQSLISASSQSGPKIYEGFKLYIYHHNIKQLVSIIGKVLDVDPKVVYERTFIKDISNQMKINYGLFRNLKNKQSSKNVQQQDISLINNKMNVTNIGQPSHFRHLSSARRKKHITVIVQQDKDKQIKQKMDKNNIVTLSMRHLQLQSNATPNQQGSHADNSAAMKTNKQLTTPFNTMLHHQPAPTTTSPFATLLYEATNKILSHIHKIIVIKTGHIDFCQNYFNKWYISPHYFNGIEKINQSISIQNQLWGFNKSIGVLCKIVRNLVSNSFAFHVRDHVIKLMDKIVNKLQNAKSFANFNSTAKLKPLSTHNIEQGRQIFNQTQMINFLDILNEIIQQDSGSLQCQYEEQSKLWYKLKQQTQFMFFNISWLSILRNFLHLKTLQLKPCNIETDNIIKNCTKNVVCAEAPKNQSQNRVSKNLKTSQLSQINQFNQNIKKPSNLSTTPGKGIRGSQSIETSQTQQQAKFNKQLCTIAKFYLEKDPTKIKIKLNILKNHYLLIGKSLLSIQQKQIERKNYFMSNMLYNRELLNKGWLNNNWISYIKESLPCQNGGQLSSSIQSLKQTKCESLKQLQRLSKDRNYSIDLTYCSSPINFIKVYMSNQFQQKTSQISSLGEQSQDSSHHHTQQKKQDSTYYYCITNSMTNQQTKKQNYIKLKSISAVGWKLNSEGTYEVTQDDKVTQLNNIYITRKLKPQQMGICEIMLAESEQNKIDNIKLYSFTKKNQGQKIGCKPAYIK